MKIIIKYVLTKAMYVKKRMFSSDENGAFDKNESRIEFKKNRIVKTVELQLYIHVHRHANTVGARTGI